MEQRAFLIMNLANIIISAFLIINIKKGGWIEELIYSKVTTVYVIPILFFVTNTVLVIIFGSGLKGMIVPCGFISIPIIDFTRDCLLQRKTNILYSKYEKGVREYLDKALLECGVPVEKDETQIFFTNNQGVFISGPEIDKCHIDLYIDSSEDVKDYISSSKRIELMLELAYSDITFEITIKRLAV